MLNLLITVVVQGTTVLAAQYWGKGEKRTVEQILGISRIYLCIMKNSGKTAKSTVIGSSSMILNVAFNMIFIFGAFGIPCMGIRGAAIATVLATMIQMLWTFWESARKDSIHIRASYFFRTDKYICRDFNRYALPIVGNYFFWGGGVTMYSVIIGHLGADAVAANAVANIARNLIVCVTKGIGTAGGILVGNELGKDEIETAKGYAKQSVILAAVLGVCSGVLQDIYEQNDRLFPETVFSI